MADFVLYKNGIFTIITLSIYSMSQILCSHFEGEVSAVFANTHDFKITIGQQNQQTAGSNEQVGHIMLCFHTSVYAASRTRVDQ
jgi:hypothetical protein